MAFGNNAGAFINGILAGHQMKRGWADDKLRREMEAEDREFMRLQRQWAQEDRGIAAQDRTRQAALAAEDAEYTRWLRENQRTEVERAEADRQAQIDAFKAAKDKQGKDTQTARSIQRKNDAGLKPIPQQAPGDAYVLPGSELGKAPAASGAPSIKRAAQPSTPKDTPAKPDPSAPTGDAAPATPPNGGPLAPPRADSLAYAGESAPRGLRSDRRASRRGTTAEQPPAQEGPMLAGRNAPRGIVAPAAATEAPQQAPQAQQAPVAAPVPSAAPEAQNVVTPSIQAATEVMEPVQSGGVTPKEIDTTVGTFMDYYRTEAVPRIVEHYLSTGQMDKAQQFQQWADDQTVKEGMQSWARAVQSAAAGDENGFLKNIVRAYNTQGYFDDGYSIVGKGSGFIKDKSGNITGAKLVFRNDETGETETRTFEDIGDIYQMGVMFLSPEQVFEYGTKQLQAAGEARQAEIEHQRAIEIEAVKKGVPPDEVEKAMTFLAENDPAFGSLPPMEQVQRAVQMIEAQGQARASLAQRDAVRERLQSGPLFQ